MKIAILTEILSTHSGSRTSIELAQVLAARHQVTLLAYSFLTDKGLLARLKHKGIKVVLVGVPAFPLGKWVAAFKFLSPLKNHDLISYHGTLPALIPAKLTSIPIIKTFHGTQKDAYLEKLLPTDQPSWPDRLINWAANQLIVFTQKAYFTLSDYNIAISKYTANEALRIYGKKVGYILQGGDNLKIKKPKGKKKQSGVYVLSISRITPYKGFHHLIESVKQCVPKVNLTITGPVSKKNYFEYLRQIKTPKTKFFHDITDHQLACLYQQCDIYASCDRLLFFGLPAAEAAFFGKPVLLMNYCAAKEVVQHGKTGFVANNQSEFTKYLQLLIDQPSLRKKMGQAGQKRAKQLFTWQRTAREYERLWQKVINQKTS